MALENIPYPHGTGQCFFSSVLYHIKEDVVRDYCEQGMSRMKQRTTRRARKNDKPDILRARYYRLNTAYILHLEVSFFVSYTKINDFYCGVNKDEGYDIVRMLIIS